MRYFCKQNISPGAVNTPMLTETFGLSDVISNNLLPVLKSEDVADAVVHVLNTPPHVEVITKQM